jgi:hypothetical protein
MATRIESLQFTVNRFPLPKKLVKARWTDLLAYGLGVLPAGSRRYEGASGSLSAEN